MLTGKFRQTLKDNFNERANALGWRNAKGKLTKKGADEAMSWLVGVHVGLELAHHEGIGTLVWIASVRGVDEVLNGYSEEKAQ